MLDENSIMYCTLQNNTSTFIIQNSSFALPLFYQQNINPSTKLAVWQIHEAEDFFRKQFPSKGLSLIRIKDCNI